MAQPLSTAAVWIKTPDGNLINLDFVSSVTVSKTSGKENLLLIKYPVAAGATSVDVITCADAPAAQSLKDTIQEIISGAFQFTDLS
jgi:hypothetical protein